MCETGYIEVDGQCVYDFGSNVLPDGTPKAPGNGGGKKPFCETPLGRQVCNAVPVILIGGAGWFESKFGEKPATTTSPKTPQPQPDKKNMPVWAWIAIGLAVVAAVVALVRRK